MGKQMITVACALATLAGCAASPSAAPAVTPTPRTAMVPTVPRPSTTGQATLPTPPTPADPDATAQRLVPPTATHPTPAPAQVNTRDPQAVANAVAVTLWSWNTTTDQSPQTAARRAARWMTPALAAIQNRNSTTNDSRWRSLATAHGWTSASTLPYAPLETHGPTTTATVMCEIVPHGAPHLAVWSSLMVITLTHDTAGSPTWQVASIQFLAST